MQEALHYINKWCLGEDLKITPNKSVIIPFTRRRETNIHKPALSGIEYSTEVEYLSHTVSKAWNRHLQKAREKSRKHSGYAGDFQEKRAVSNQE